jgi:hypothetical protein
MASRGFQIGVPEPIRPVRESHIVGEWGSDGDLLLWYEERSDSGKWRADHSMGSLSMSATQARALYGLLHKKFGREKG